MTGAQQPPESGHEDGRGLAEAAVRFAAPGVDVPVPLVAIGASAGGLDAIEQFFAAVPFPSRFAFVIVRRLSSDFKNLMVELLAKRTPLAVEAVEDGTKPEADVIHLIPPDKTMTIEDGRFRLVERDRRDFVHHPIDEFFVSLATDRGRDAIAVILSGSGSDGSRGARAIRAAGGRVLVQRPATARFSSMPQAAIEAGCSQEVMPADVMPGALLEPGPNRLVVETDDNPASKLSPAIAECLASALGIDVAAYCTERVQRRVQRRMMLKGFDQLAAYADFIADDIDEQEALFQDLLIGVTGFLPDEAARHALDMAVLPGLATQLANGETIRVWVAGCATGEEAYALTMRLLDRCRQPVEAVPLKVFATDIHRRSLAVAGAGLYAEAAVRSLPADWQARFFSRRGSGFQVGPELRDKLAFSVHDLLYDLPMTKLHLISCRNVVSFLRPEAREKVLAGLANALLPGGHLLLGPAEAPAGQADLWAPVDVEAGLYRRRPAPALDHATGQGSSPGRSLTVSPGGTTRSERRDQRLTAAQERLLDRYVPPTLLVDEAGQVVHCFGDAGAWLKAPTGRASLAVLDMVEDALRAPLAAAVTRARQSGQAVVTTGLRLADLPDAPILERLVVEPLGGRSDALRGLLVSFDDRPRQPDLPDVATAARLAGLEASLQPLLEVMPTAAALAQGERDQPLHLTAANLAFVALAQRCGLATPLAGQALQTVLSALLDASFEPTELAASSSFSWTTKTGATLTLEPLPATGHHVAILRLAPPATLSTPAPEF